MNFLKKLVMSAAAILSASTVICGLSIASKPIVEASSLQFHMAFGLTALLFCFISIALFACKKQTVKEV